MHYRQNKSFKKNVISLEGIRLTYYTIGSGKPVLFLHGGRVRALTFKKNLELLAKEFFVIAPDIPGYGASTTPRELWSFKDYAHFFELFLKQLNLHNVSVVGYSLGGGIALYMAEKSKYIKNAIFIDPAGLTKSNRTLFFADIKRLLFYLIHPQNIPSLFILMRDYVQYLIRHISDWKQMAAIREKSGLVGYKQQTSIKIRSLILWGKDDWFFPKQLGVTLQKQISNSILEIVDGNHDWIVYNPKLFINKISPFLSKN